MPSNNEDFQNGGGEFYVAGMGLGRKMHLYTGEYSAKCLGNKLGDVQQEIGPIPHPGGKLTLKKAAAAIAEQAKSSYRLLGIDEYNLCPKCFPNKEG